MAEPPSVTHDDTGLQPSRRWRLAWACGTVLLLVAVVPLLAVLALERSSRAERFVVSLAANALRESAGLGLSVERLRVRRLGRKIEISGLTLAGEDGRPFVTVELARARLRPLSFLGHQPVIESLVLEGVLIDVGATPPAPPAAPTPAGPGLDLQIVRFEVRDLTARSGPVPSEWEPWLDGCRLHAVEVAGSLSGASAVILHATGAFTAESRRRPPIEGRFRLVAEGARGGAFRVNELAVAGEGLRIDAVASGALTARLPFEARVETDLDAGRLFPDLTADGRLEGVVSLARPEPTRWTASVRMSARGFPGELLTPLVEPAGLGDLHLAGSRIAGEADLMVAVPSGSETGPLAVTGRATLDWTRRDERLLTLALESTPAAGGAARVTMEAEWLPDAPGRRRITGSIDASAWSREATGVADLALELEVPRLEDRRFYMGLDAGWPWRPVGDLVLNASIHGDLRAPKIAATGTYSVGESRLATFEAETPDAARGVALRFEASFLPDEPGRRHMSGLLSAPALDPQAARLDGVVIEVDLPDVGDAGQRLAETLDAVAPPEVAAEWSRLRPRLAGLLRGSATARLRADGAWAAPTLGAELSWRPTPGEEVGLEAAGRWAPGAAYGIADLTADLVVHDLDVLPLLRSIGVESEPGTVGGHVGGRLRITGPLDRPAGELTLWGRDLRLGAGPAIAELAVDARSDGRTLELAQLVATLAAPIDLDGKDASAGAAPAAAAPWLRARGRAIVDGTLIGGELDVEAHGLVEGLGKTSATLRLIEGVLAVEAGEVRYGEEVVRLDATLPLGSLGEISRRLEALAIPTAEGPVRVRFGSLDLVPLLSLFGVDSPVEATLDGTFVVDSRNLVASSGEVEVSGIRIRTDGGRRIAAPDLKFALAEGRLRLVDEHVVVRGPGSTGEIPLQLRAKARLDTGWQPEHGWEALIADVALAARGTADASLLTPFLLGLGASGPVALELDVSGPLHALDGSFSLSGLEASLLYPGAYALKLDSPEIRVALTRGKPRIEQLRGRLNGGTLEASGGLGPDGELVLHTRVRGSRFRLDYGVTVVADTDLQLRSPRTGLRRLSGEINVVRGVLRRDLNLEREALRVLFEPAPGGNTALLESVALDLTVNTAEGVFIDNNLADLHADWSGLRVGGTLARPRLSGRVDVDPGGWLNAFGTVYRVDELSLSWLDEAPSDARLVIETTSSIEDPSLKQQYRGLAFTGLGERGPGSGGSLDFVADQSPTYLTAESVTSGLVNYYQDRLAGSLSRGMTEFAYEPLPLFGETDTEARFTVSQQVSSQATLLWSTDPRQSQGQTWILDLHDFTFAPRWRGQIFTSAEDSGSNGDNGGGATLQQTLGLGGGAPEDDAGTRLRRIVVQAPEDVSRRQVRAASGYRRGDPFIEGAVLDVEVDVAEMLRRRGYPAPEVDLTHRALEQGQVELDVAIAPGARTSFVFEGDPLPKPAHRDVIALYRTGEQEPAALVEMRSEALRWLRARGHDTPDVRIVVEPGQPPRVRLTIDAGRLVTPGPPELRGLPAEEALLTAAQFDTTLERIELAAGVPSADSYLLQSLRAQGYPGARIAGRESSEAGDRLLVDVEPGPRQRVAAIEIAGVPPDEAVRLAGFLQMKEGDPPLFGAISGSAHAMEDDLNGTGHVGARVRGSVVAGPAEHPLDVVVRFEVDPGAVHRIARVRYEGLRGSRAGWVRRESGLAQGELLSRERIAEARRNLYRTGVFSRIQVQGDGLLNEEAAVAPSSTPEITPKPGAEAEVPADLVFEMRESQRYWLSYGLRWEDDLGLGAVVDLVDRNSLGRGHVSGARVIYGEDLKSLRFYHQIPRIVRQRSSLELFLEGREELIDLETTAESIQFWTQLTTPIGPRTQTRVYGVVEDRKLVAGSRQELDDRVISPRLGWQWVYTTIDRALGADRRGWFLGLDLSGAHEALGSDVTTLAGFEQFKLFVPFGKSGRNNWAQSWRFGVVDARDDDVPSADRLRAGGSYSVRGYPSNSLGPLAPDGTALGGEVQFIVNQELQRNLTRSIAALVFFDAGNVWESIDGVDSELFRSVGLGARYLSPVGPLRFDIAWPLDRRPDDDTYEIYLGFGQVF